MEVNNNLAHQMFVFVIFCIFMIFLIDVLTYEKEERPKVQKTINGIPKDEMWFQRT